MVILIGNHYYDMACIFNTELVPICINFMLKYLGQIEFNFQFFKFKL